MSGSKEKLKRQEERKLGIEKRQVQQQRAEKEQKRKKIILRISGIAVALIIALLLVFNSNILYRNYGAVEVNGKSFTITDYRYYNKTLYYQYFNTYYNYYGEYYSYFMPDEAALEKETLKLMADVTMLHNEAEAAGFTVSEESKKTIDETIASLKDTAKQNNFTSVNSYLNAYYGQGMNTKILRENIEYYNLAMEYSNHIASSFEYTDAQKKDYYAEHKDEFDVIDYRSFFFSGAAVEDNKDTPENEAVDSATAMANAEKLAREYASKITDEASFTTLAYEYAEESAKESYKDADSTLISTKGSDLNEANSSWLLDAARQKGDVTVTSDDTGYYVLYYIGRSANDYRTENVRHILIAPEVVNKADYDTDEAYKKAQDDAKAAALAKAEEIYKEWKTGAATEESFAELADKNSADSPEGGLYENVYKGQMVEEFENWIYADARKAGDTEIVETSYGYHIMYYVSEGQLYSDYLAEQAMRNDDYNKWYEGKIADYTAETKKLFGFLKK